MEDWMMVKYERNYKVQKHVRKPLLYDGEVDFDIEEEEE